MEASFTKLVPPGKREWMLSENGGSFTELGSYPLLAVLKTLGHKIENINFISFVNHEGVDIYTKAYLQYSNAVATIKVGLGVKSEGNLVISGTRGNLYAEAPWWMTRNYELHYEDVEQNEQFFYKYLGQGLRYEIAAFVSRIDGYKNRKTLMKNQDSIVLAELMEKYLASRKNGTMVIMKMGED